MMHQGDRAECAVSSFRFHGSMAPWLHGKQKMNYITAPLGGRQKAEIEMGPRLSINCEISRPFLTPPCVYSSCVRVFEYSSYGS